MLETKAICVVLRPLGESWSWANTPMNSLSCCVSVYVAQTEMAKSPPDSPDIARLWKKPPVDDPAKLKWFRHVLGLSGLTEGWTRDGLADEPAPACHVPCSSMACTS